MSPTTRGWNFSATRCWELVVSQYLYQSLPDMPEDADAHARPRWCARRALFQAARRLSWGGFVRLSVGEERTGGREKPSILADVAEAVFAAVSWTAAFRGRAAGDPRWGSCWTCAPCPTVWMRNRACRRPCRSGAPCRGMNSSPAKARRTPTFRYQCGKARPCWARARSNPARAAGGGEKRMQKLGADHCG